MAEKENTGHTLAGLHVYTLDEKQKKIKKALKKLKGIFELMPDDNKALSESLLKNVAFMQVELSELEQIIMIKGSVEEYKNGANQTGYKQSSAVQAYNSLLKSYNSSLRLLLSQLPEGEAKSAAKDKLAAFLMGD